MTLEINSHYAELNTGAVRSLSLRYPSFFGQDVETMRSAEMICFGQNATALVRNGSFVRKYQIAGLKDAHEFEVEGEIFRLQGFRVHAPMDAKTVVSAFVRAAALPAADLSVKIRDRLEKLTGVFIVLIPRNDPFF